MQILISSALDSRPRLFGLRAFLTGCVALGALAAANAAHAAGTELPYQDTDSLATAYGGALTDDGPAIAYNNPAGMVLIQGNQFEGDLQFYQINSSFSGKDSFTDGTTASGNANPSGFLKSTFVPGTFSVTSLPDGIKFGVTVTNPEGGRIKYPDDFIGRYQGQEALLTDVQIGVPIAIPITDKLSIGGGPVIDWFQNYDSVNQNLGGLNTFTPDGDGAVGRFRGSNYRLGFELGTMYQLSPDTRFGLAYHSKITHDIKGTETVAVLSPLNAVVPYATPATDQFTFPQTVSFGVFQRLSPQWDVMASAQFNNWSAVSPLIIADAQIAPLAGGAIYTPFRFRDSWTVGAGFNYYPAPKLKLMGGIGYDESPVKPQYRNDTLPDNNRFVISGGVSYQVLANVKLQAAYAHYFLANSSINQARDSLPANGIPVATAAGLLTGTYDINVNVFSTGIVLSF